MNYLLLPLLTLSFFGSLRSWAAESCEQIVQTQGYMYEGHAADAPPDKIYNFAKVRDDILGSLESPDKAECLRDFYRDGLQQEADFWARCSDSSGGADRGGCPSGSEVDKSLNYVKSLNADLENKLNLKIQAAEVAKQAKLAGATQEKCGGNKSGIDSALELQDKTCCGEKSDQGGMLRGIQPGISYETCLSRTHKSDQKFFSAQGVGDCLGRAIGSALQTLWDSMTAIFKLPGQLWGARAQIWALMTQPAARAQLVQKMTSMIGDMINEQVGAVKCMNPYERAQYVCQIGGQIVGACATPEVVGTFIQLGSKAVTGASRILEGILAKTAKGQKVLATLSKAKSAGEAGLAAVGKVATKVSNKASEIPIPKALQEAAAKAGKVLKTADDVRRFVGKPLSLAAEKAALKIESSAGSFGDMLAASARTRKIAKLAKTIEKTPELQSAKEALASGAAKAPEAQAVVDSDRAPIAKDPPPVVIQRKAGSGANKDVAATLDTSSASATAAPKASATKRRYSEKNPMPTKLKERPAFVSKEPNRAPVGNNPPPVVVKRQPPRTPTSIATVVSESRPEALASARTFVQDFRQNGLNAATAGIADEGTRASYAKSLIGRDISEAQKASLTEAHNVPCGDYSINNPCNSKKGLILRRAGYSELETRTIMESGLAGGTRADRMDAIHRLRFDEGDMNVQDARRGTYTIKGQIETKDPARFEQAAKLSLEDLADPTGPARKMNMDSRDYSNAFFWSLRGQGEVAKDMLLKRFPRDGAGMVSDLEAKGFLQLQKDPHIRENLYRIYTEIKDGPEFKELNFTAQDQIRRAWGEK